MKKPTIDPMNINHNHPGESAPVPAQAPLRLGCREDIGVLGGKVPEDATEVQLYTGFDQLTGEGRWVKQSVQRTTRNDAGLAPQDCVEKVLLPELRRAWDEAATQLGVQPARKRPSLSPTGPSTPPTMEEIVHAELDLWREWQCHSLSTFRGYKYAAESFLKHSGQLANVPGYTYTEDDIPGIVGRMLANTNTHTRAPRQLLRNVRFVLRRIPGFPEPLVAEFDVPKPKRGGRRA